LLKIHFKNNDILKVQNLNKQLWAIAIFLNKNKLTNKSLYIYKAEFIN